MAVFRSTTWYEREDSPSGGYSTDRGQVNRDIQVAWAARGQAALDFAGDVAVVNDGSGRNYLSRTIPHAFPPRPWMYVQSIPAEKPLALKGKDGSDVGVYSLAILTLQYVMPPFRVKDDGSTLCTDASYFMHDLPDEGWALAVQGVANSRYVTRQIKHATKVLVYNRGMLKDENSKLILEGIPITEFVGEWSYTWHQVPEEALPEKAWIDGAKCVNSTTFDGRPAGTLLFAGDPEIRMDPNPITGKFLYTVTYRFHSLLLVDDTTTPHTIRGHNYILRPSAGSTVKPQKFTTDGLGVNPGTVVYRDFDFASFFRPDQP